LAFFPKKQDQAMNFKYDIAVSFAGEDRAVVEEFVNALAANDISVFYYPWEQAQLWGQDLYQHLYMIYQQAAQYCVIFISEHYARKAWTQHELRSAQARAFQQNSEYILPIKLDDTELLGLPRTIAYMDLRRTSIQEVANLVSKKIGVAGRPNVTEVRKLIASENTTDRLSALSQIAVFKLKDLLDTTIDIMLHDGSPRARERAAWALDNLNDQRALSALITALHDENFGVRSAAGWGLVHLGEIVMPSMQEVIENDEDLNAKQMARFVLSNL
jgi:TIR domain/HEAT repeats